MKDTFQVEMLNGVLQGAVRLTACKISCSVVGNRLRIRQLLREIISHRVRQVVLLWFTPTALLLLTLISWRIYLCDGSLTHVPIV